MTPNQHPQLGFMVLMLLAVIIVLKLYFFIGEQPSDFRHDWCKDDGRYCISWDDPYDDGSNCYHISDNISIRMCSIREER